MTGFYVFLLPTGYPAFIKLVRVLTVHQQPNTQVALAVLLVAGTLSKEAILHALCVMVAAVRLTGWNPCRLRDSTFLYLPPRAMVQDLLCK